MYKKIYELACMDVHKSFHSKARVKECANGEKLLQSYDTIVCKLDVGGNFVRLWSGYSATAQCHINSFLQLNGLDELQGKANWDKMPAASPRRPHFDMTWQDYHRAMMARRAVH